MRFRAVFFDAGETLVHPHPSFTELFAQVLRREGFDVDEAAVAAKVHVIGERFSEAARDEELWTTSPSKSQAFWLGVYERFLEELEVPGAPELHAVLYREFTDLANYRAFADVRPALDSLREAGLLLGVVSNFEAWLEGLLDALGMAEDFAVRVVSGAEGMEKPDPRIYELALERAGVGAQESAFVGDNPEFDVDPPAKLGMFPVLIDRRGRHPDFDGERITDMRDLPAALGIGA